MSIFIIAIRIFPEIRHASVLFFLQIGLKVITGNSAQLRGTMFVDNINLRIRARLMEVFMPKATKNFECNPRARITALGMTTLGILKFA